MLSEVSTSLNAAQPARGAALSRVLIGCPLFREKAVQLKITRKSTSVQLKNIHYAFDVRSDNSNSQETIGNYIALREAGLPFETNILITEDGMVIDGRHRFEAEERVAQKNTPEGQDAGDTYITVDVATGINWETATAVEKLFLRDFSFGQNVHKEGRPATQKDLEQLVGYHLDMESEEQTIAALRTKAPVRLLRKAIETVKNRNYKIQLTAARQLMQNGMSATKAKAKLGLPADVDLEERNRKGSTDKTSTSKIKEDADKLATSWYNRANRYRDNFINGEISQDKFSSSAQAFIRAAERLNRMAANIQERTNECIASHAKRLTAVA